MAGGEAGRRKVGGGQGRVRKACGTLSQEDEIRASEARILGSPMPGGEPGALECPLRSRRGCLTSPCPGGQDGPCERHTNEPSPAERLTRSPLSLIKVASHVYSVPVKPISCESVVGPAFDWILVNSELLK